LIHNHRNAYSEFKSKIRNTAPNFKPFVNTTEAQKAAAKWPDADGDEECVSTEAPLYLEDMRRHIEKSITRELAHNVPFEAKVTLIQAFQRGWGGFMLACFESVVGSTFELLLERLKDHFSRYGALQMQLRYVEVPSFAFITPAMLATQNTRIRTCQRASRDVPQDTQYDVGSGADPVHTE
jgi:hypothetical protein